MKRLVYVGTAVLAVALYGCQRRTTEQGTKEEGTQQDTGAYGGGSQAGQPSEETGAGQGGSVQQGQQGQPAEQGQQGGAAQEMGEGTGAYGAGGASCAQVSSCFSKISDELCKGDSRCQSTFSSGNVPKSEDACRTTLSQVKGMVQPYARQQTDFELPSECQAPSGASSGQQEGTGQGMQEGSSTGSGSHDQGSH